MLIRHQFIPAMGTEHSSKRLSQQEPKLFRCRVAQNFWPAKSSKYLRSVVNCCPLTDDAISTDTVSSSIRNMIENYCLLEIRINFIISMRFLTATVCKTSFKFYDMQKVLVMTLAE